MTTLVISYAPLFDYRQPYSLDPVNDRELCEATIRRWEAHPNMASACLWVFEKGTIVPVLLIPKAKEIVEHLTAWAEGNPQEWFRVHAYRNDRGYAIALFPNLEKSLERFKLNYLALHSTFVDLSDVKYHFRPLVSIVGHHGHFDEVMSNLGTSIGFADVEFLKDRDPSSIRYEDIAFLHDMTYSDPEFIRDFVDEDIRKAADDHDNK